MGNQSTLSRPGTQVIQPWSAGPSSLWCRDGTVPGLECDSAGSTAGSRTSAFSTQTTSASGPVADPRKGTMTSPLDDLKGKRTGGDARHHQQALPRGDTAPDTGWGMGSGQRQGLAEPSRSAAIRSLVASYYMGLMHLSQQTTPGRHKPHEPGGSQRAAVGRSCSCMVPE